MNSPKYRLLLADDDDDDRVFFKDALEELEFPVGLVTVNDGVQLMNYLTDNISLNLPDMVFLDLNMPRKNGFECLSEIKMIDELKNLPIIIFSTSLDINIVDLLYEKGANYYIRKPGEFGQLKKALSGALSIISEKELKQPSRDLFILPA